MTISTNRGLVQEYFACITRRNLEALLDLFVEEAVVYEPFSNQQGGLRGRSEIEPFLRVALMANTGLDKKITFAEEVADRVTALVTFRRGDEMRGRFTFASKDVPTPHGVQKKICSLKIEFLN